MQIREASIEKAEEACLVIKRSITELCQLDHQCDPHTLELWLANKTTENMRRWIREGNVFIGTDDSVILGVAAINNSGGITLNYVSPDARFRGVSKALITRLEAKASELGEPRVTLQSTATARRFYFFCWLRRSWAAHVRIRPDPWLSNGEATSLGLRRRPTGTAR